MVDFGHSFFKKYEQGDNKLKKLSVIVPVYQGERTIEKCVASILSNVTDLEVLIINDGSTDRTAEICEQLAAADSRIRFWTKVNEGPGAARKFAMDYTEGMYVTFVDADDYLRKYTYDLLWEYVDERLDILEYGYQLEDLSGKVLSKHPMNPEEYYDDDCGLHYAKQKNTTNYLWNKIFKKDLFNNACFLQLFAAEDAALMSQLFVFAKHCKAVPDVLYHYVMTPDSLCRKPFSERRMDNLTAYWFVDAFYARTRPELRFYTHQKICSLAAKLYCECSVLDGRNIQQWKQQFKNDFQKAKNGYTLLKLISHGSLNRKLLIILFSVSPPVCSYIYNLRGQ